MLMKSLFLWCCAVLALFVAGRANAQDPIQFARTPAISPDGSHVAFSYLGDLWIVDAKGGPARLLTMHEKHDFNPVFSPDGKHIAFSSNRHGQYDVFVIPVEGGRPTRLTFDSGDDHVTAWTPDSQRVLFTSGRLTEFPMRLELYSVAATGGQAQRVTAFEGRDASYSPKGDLLAYTRGPGSWFRKLYKGSSNDDLWVCNADGTNNRRLTTHPGQDNHPQWAPDGKTLYYVTDALSTLTNLVRQEIDPERGVFAETSKPVQMTHHKDESVRRARLSANGEWIVYECGVDLHLYSVKDGKSRKLAIQVSADDKANVDRIQTFSANATEYALSSDEKHIAFVVHGEIFLMPRNGGKAKRLTDHPGLDHGVAWSPDSKRMFFLSDRGGHEDIYLLEGDDPDHPDLVQAHRFKVKQITNTPEPETAIGFAPDGSKVAFLRAGKLMLMNPDGTGEKLLAKNGQIFDYEWSPDSKWICYARSDSAFASELFIIPASGATEKEPARNITRFATFNGGVTWSKTGNRIAFLSNRKRDQQSAYVLSLQKPTATGVAPSKDIDWEGIHLRVRQPANMNVTECALSPDGTKIAFRASLDGDDLWVANVDGGQVSRLTTGSVKPSQIQWSKIFTSQIFFRDGSGSLRVASLGGVPGVPPSAIPFQARMTIRQEELFLEMFDQSWRALDEAFYDSNFHGANWKKLRGKYRELVKHCAMKEDLYSLVSLMLGELNASHLGISGVLATPEQKTAELGLVFDDRYAGPGLKIRDILKGGPADQRGINLKVGDVVMRIDGVELDGRVDIAKLLNDKVGETIILHASPNPADPIFKRRVEIVGAERTTITKLQYERWIQQNADQVTKLSGGKLGYIHIPSMDEEGLDRFVRALYSDNFDKEGIVLDVRYNGGGFTHDQVINFLVGKEHTYFTHRDGSQGVVVRNYDRKWSKPLTLLINNRSFSDAEIFPHPFPTWGLGKIVGQPTGGHVIFTRNIQLIDGSQFRTPRIGVFTNKGVNMDKEGVAPDILVEAHPDQLAKGHDVQLEKAVEVLTKDVASWKKARPPIAGLPPRENPGETPTVTPAPGSGPMPRRED
jgi:tricorn protease